MTFEEYLKSNFKNGVRSHELRCYSDKDGAFFYIFPVGKGVNGYTPNFEAAGNTLIPDDDDEVEIADADAIAETSNSQHVAVKRKIDVAQNEYLTCRAATSKCVGLSIGDSVEVLQIEWELLGFRIDEDDRNFCDLVLKQKLVDSDQ